MRRIYKRVFDIAYFLSLTGFYVIMARHAVPYAPGVALLFLSVILDEVLTGKAGQTAAAQKGAAENAPAGGAAVEKTGTAAAEKSGKILSCLAALPAAAVLFLILYPAQFTDVSQYWQLVPLAIYIIFVILRRRSDVTYEVFLSQFRFALRTYLIFIPGLIFSSHVAEAAAGIMPYIVTFLGTAVCLLRFLREDHSGSKNRTAFRQGLLLAAFIFLCFLMTEGNALYYMGVVLHFLYYYVFRYIIIAAAYVILYVVYFGSIGFYYLAQWLGLLSVEMPEQPVTNDLPGASEWSMQGTPEEVAVNPVLQAIAIIAGILAVGTVIFFILRRMLGEKIREDAAGRAEMEVSERVEGGKKRALPRIFRPSDPKMAVRFYFEKLMRECRKRGVPPEASDTSREISVRAAEVFDGGDAEALRRLYVAARYGPGEGDPEAVKESAALWKNLRAGGK